MKKLFLLLLVVGFASLVNAQQIIAPPDDNCPSIIDENGNVSLGGDCDADVGDGGNNGGGNTGGGVQTTFPMIIAGSERFSDTVRVQCESWNFENEDCVVPERITNVTLVQQLSSASCTGNFSVQSGFVLRVRNGCRGVFTVTLANPRQLADFTCSSINRAARRCVIPGGRGAAWIHTRLSNSECIFQETFIQLTSDEFIDVRDGCRARFTVGYF